MISVPAATQQDNALAANLTARFAPQIGAALKRHRGTGISVAEQQQLRAKILDVILRWKRLCKFQNVRATLSMMVVNFGPHNPTGNLVVTPPTLNGSPLGGFAGPVGIDQLEQVGKPGMVLTPGTVSISD